MRRAFTDRGDTFEKRSSQYLSQHLNPKEIRNIFRYALCRPEADVLGHGGSRGAEALASGIRPQVLRRSPVRPPKPEVQLLPAGQCAQRGKRLGGFSI